MANKTIYGCRDKTTGVITFEGEACDSGNYVGCRVKSGIHAGQIAVTILEDACDDTYYSCRNKTTGKFQLIIPDDCCTVTGNCNNCTTYSIWVSTKTYSTGNRVTHSGLCYISLQGANTNIEPTIHPDWAEWWRETDCHCPAEYSDTDSDACCFDAGETPLYLCITVEGMRKCSDDQVIDTFSVCVEQSAVDKFNWCGNVSIEGDNCIVHYSPDGRGCSSELFIYSSTKIYYEGCSGNYCSAPNSDLIKASCGNSTTWEGAWFPCGDGIDIIVSAYGGSCSVCNPVTGQNLTPC